MSALGLTRRSLLGGATLVLIGSQARADAFPNRTIRIVVPWAPGGVADIVARLISDRLTAQLGQPVIVENRAGASGMIGTDFVAKSPPDGYTLVLVTASTHAMGPSVVTTTPYDPVKDFAPIIQVTTAPAIMVVPKSLPASTVAEFVALAKQKPGQLNFASFGVGSSAHLAAELFMQATGTRMVHVTYKGSAPAIIDLMGDRVQLFFDSIPSALPHVRAGDLKALAVTGLMPTAAAPDLPTVAASIPGFDFTVWQGLAAPAGTPAVIVQKIYVEVAKIMAQPEVKKILVDLGADPVSVNPDGFAAYILRENEKWRRLAKDAKISVAN
ncbi:Bug family tripartite tricarboxylate transporter substrate binding protein [Bradyrhizobium canariense]|uniref:Tripartite-type tricarboxylate transporter, receptor component TctC n=1 Tax=Bradyrhizobium canariense TaxID=255045 RepID=A0A1H2B4X7_9BRAD|nr:tripartite tricarboxylate transporter substrate binding protein [Bradyrhizobium canariense]SDT53223.1 Tripartite-type tricarboxylate transporter, receptor component TctC [Bradyrhizobium canariense]